ncbi:cell wall protein DAN4-like isoform X12 [Haliotis rubra]|uniref:cell wall protein DAN4-like isoform X12 n=1 Tax=Haliotis rubra TaxID=36100 RepID=UPI001EE4FA9A|nr:cell wall protein DAN4-like isoform X12 [Haliotis rubra]
MRSTGFLLIVLQIVNGNLLDTTTLSPSDTTQSDPCTASHEIASADRVVSSDVTTGRCDDNLNAGWYKFTVNNVAATLPTVCLRPGACGADVSLRIDLGDQSLPDVGEEVQAWSCGAYDILGKFDCCVLRQPARIRNCSSFLAYQLQKPDRCDVAYCVEHPELKIPPNVLVKYGEDVSPQSTTPSSSTVTTPDFHNLKWCNEGLVWCTRGAPRCMSYEECLAIPLTTTSSSDVTTTTSQVTTQAATTETTPSSDVTTEKTTVDSDVTTSPNIAEKTTLASDGTTPPHIETTETTSHGGSTSPEKAGSTPGSGITNTGAEETTTSQTTSQTTVLRGLFSFTTTTSANDDSVTTEESTSKRHSSTASMTTTGDYTTTGSIGGMPGHPDGVSKTDAITTEGTSTAETTEAASDQTTGPSSSPSGDYTTTGSIGRMPGHPDGVSKTDAITTEGTSTAETTEAASGQTTGSSSSPSATTAAAAGGHVDRSTNQDTTSSISTTSAASSPTTMASTSASSSATQSTSKTLPPVHSTEGSSSRSPSSSTESSDVTTEARSTKSTSTSPLGPVDGRIVLEYGWTDCARVSN